MSSDPISRADVPIDRAVFAIAETDPAILAALSVQEVRAEVEQLTARLVATARQRQREQS